MRPLPLLAALVLTCPIALASTELELLQDRCAEQERQIRQLEEENGRLKSLMDTAAATPATRTQASTRNQPPAAASETQPRETSSPSYGTVQAGDSLTKLAKRHGTTPEVLIKLNNLKNPSLIRAGQKLILPSKTSAPAARPSSPVGRSHIVKTGETFYSIARHNGISVESLAAANPGVKATTLRPGQKLQLASATAETGVAKSVPAAAPAAKPEVPSSTAQAVTKVDASSPSPLESSSRTVSTTPRIKSVLVTEETDFGAFAAAHGTTTEKLNALNGHSLKPSTVLAKGSEFYVPAQP